MSKRTPKFTVLPAPSLKGQFFVRLTGANGKIIATTETYKGHKHALRAAASFQAAAIVGMVVDGVPPKPLGKPMSKTVKPDAKPALKVARPASR